MPEIKIKYEFTIKDFGSAGFVQNSMSSGIATAAS